MKNLNILHVTDCYDGGVQTAINNLLAVLPEANHSLMYGFVGNSPALEFANQFEFTSKSWMKRFLLFRRLDRSGKFDVIHVHSSRAGALTRIRKTKTPLIYQPHGISFAQPRARLFNHALFLIEKILARNSCLSIAVSPNELNLLNKLNTKSRNFIVPNFSQISGERVGKKYVLMIGRIVELKGPDFFIEAARNSILSAEITFMWIGQGDPEITQKLKQSGIEVTGWLNQSEIKKYVSQAQAYFHTSSSEGFPISVLDAANVGAPIIVRNIDAFIGMDILKIDNPLEAAQALMNLQNDPNFENQLIDKSRKLAGSHSALEARRAYLEALESVTN